MTCGREASDVCHLAPGDEPARDTGRQAEQLAQPLHRDVFDDGRARARRVEASVLIPDRREPVGSDRRRVRAAHHEPEKASARHPGDARLGYLDEISDEFQRLDARLGQRTAECRQELVPRRTRGEVAFRE